MNPFLQIIWFLKLFSVSPHYCVDLPRIPLRKNITNSHWSFWPPQRITHRITNIHVGEQLLIRELPLE
jgi:hypothetical protein